MDWVILSSIAAASRSVMSLPGWLLSTGQRRRQGIAGATALSSMSTTSAPIVAAPSKRSRPRWCTASFRHFDRIDDSVFLGRRQHLFGFITFTPNPGLLLSTCASSASAFSPALRDLQKLLLQRILEDLLTRRDAI